MIQKLLRESLNTYINEIDWKEAFSDVKKKCIPVKDIVQYLNDLQQNSKLDYPKRKKFSKDVPYLHANTKLIKRDEEFTIAGIDYFIQQITTPPLRVISQNEKMEASGEPNEFVYNTGIPAIKGLVYDIEEKKFYYVNTCPGAGDCMTMCYGLHGFYVMYPHTYDALTRRLNYLLNSPDEYEKKLFDELAQLAKEHKAVKGSVNKVILRWNDSGDFFTKKYIEIAERAIKNLQDAGYNVASYAYTKMANVAKGDHFDMPATFSMGSSPEQISQVNLKKQKISVIIPKPLFKGLKPTMVDDLEKIKVIIVNDPDIKRQDPTIKINNIITYYQLKKMAEGDVAKWHVIVPKGAGDEAAMRKDVKAVLLLQH